MIHTRDMNLADQVVLATPSTSVLVSGCVCLRFSCGRGVSAIFLRAADFLRDGRGMRHVRAANHAPTHRVFENRWSGCAESGNPPAACACSGSDMPFVAAARAGIDLAKIAEKLPGASGAEIKAVCTEAGMYALRERRVHVTQEDFEMSVGKVMAKDNEKNMSLKKLFK